MLLDRIDDKPHRKHDLSFIKDTVRTVYKSLDHPDFSFVKKTFKARPYDPIVTRLRDYAVVEEWTQSEDDVCFSYILKGHAALWKLDLSLIGPFGIFVRCKNSITREDFIHHGRSDLFGNEIKVVEILTRAGIRLLQASELKAPLPMTLFNTNREEVCLYQALFSDRPDLPWKD